MPIRQRHIDELKRLYENHFGKRIGDKQVWEMAHRLLNTFRLLMENQEKNAKETPPLREAASSAGARSSKSTHHDQSPYENDRDLRTKID